MDIGQKLKELRVLKNLTQEELADRAELSKGFISQLERNSDLPVHRHINGYPSVPRNKSQRVLH